MQRRNSGELRVLVRKVLLIMISSAWCTGKNTNCLYGLAGGKSWSCSLKDDKHHRCPVWEQIYQKCTCLFVHLDATPPDVQFHQSSFCWPHPSCPSSRLWRIQPPWVIAQQGQGPLCWHSESEGLLPPALTLHTHTRTYVLIQWWGDQGREEENREHEQREIWTCSSHLI